jgi:NAD-dependent deacetylase
VRLAFLTGAGMSAESGVPTFRDALTGLWSRFDAEQLATEAAFRRDPALVWGWYRWRAALVQRVQPNPGHRAIAALADDHAVRVVTQNVDDLHERAGMPGVVHLHGSLFATRCIHCGVHADGTPDPILRDAALIPADGGHEAPPRCAHCAGALRPGVVWFGEALPARPWDQAVAAITACELLVVVGTSGLVHPAAALPAMARDADVRVLEINPVATPLTAIAHASWRTTASTGLARLADDLAASRLP